MTNPFHPPMSASVWGTPGAVLSAPFKDLGGPEQKAALLMAAEIGCLARFARKHGLTRPQIEKTLAAVPALPAAFSDESEILAAKRLASYEARRDAHWQASIRAVCAAVNAARLAGGHAVGAVFLLSLADLAKALGLREDTAKGKLRLVGRAGFVHLHAIGGGGCRPVSVPQSTIDELGLEP